MFRKKCVNKIQNNLLCKNFKTVNCLLRLHELFTKLTSKINQIKYKFAERY